MTSAVSKASARLLRARPDFLIIGAQKAGTTSLFHYLASHPDAAPAGCKEINYFSLHYERGLAWYLSHFPYRQVKAGRRCFEASPGYLTAPEAPARIRSRVGRPRLVVVLRDPAERAYSAWRMWRHYDEKPAKQDHRSFGEAVREELADPEASRREPHRYVAVGRYADHLARYREHFDAGDMLLLDYGDLERDFDGFLARLCGFVGLRPFERAEIEPLRGARYWSARGAERTDDDLRTLETLRGYYAPHNERLRAEFGFSPSW